MKKTRLSTILLSVLTLLCSIFILVSCGGGGGNNNGDDPTPTPTPSTPTKLTAPTVVLTDDTAIWSADASADKFEISVDGNLSYIENLVTSRKLTDGQTFKIRAIGDGTNYTNSDWSNSVTYVKPIPKYTITWKSGDTVLETDTEVSEGTLPTYDGAEPTKAADAQYSYVFAGWSPEVAAAIEDTTYTAVFNSVPHKCTVTWKNGDSVLETDENVEYGTTPTYDGVEPTKAADAQYSYVFAGWTPEVVAANGNVTYTAVFTSVLNKYTVTWKNGDTTLETDENVAYGTMPAYNGAEPQKAADAQYVYVFSGWSPVVSEVVGNVTYVAQFTSAPNSYTIVWKNGDTVLETDENVVYGSTPSYDGATPTKATTAQYTYTFSGWTPQINSVTGSVTYQAQFTEALRTYTITFYSEDGLTVLDTVTVEYGSNAVYSKSTPVKNATAGYTYVFEKWVTTQGGSVEDDLTNVIGDRSVYASFKEFVRTVTVYIVSNNTDYGTVSVSTLNNVPYGATITVNGNTVTINGQTVTANANTATAQYTYTFANWTDDATVGNDTIITANFSRSVNSYTVTWKNGDDTLETDENVAYGTTPVYNGVQPTKESDNENIYTFSGWSPAISSVIGDVTYIAQFTTAANKHIVVFYDDDGVTELGRVVVGHGETAIYPNALPTKESTAEITYTFEKWVTAKDGATEASFANITGDKSVYAKYSTTARTYVVTFCDYDGTTISQIDVAYGNAATAPGDPEREGYRFDGWDKTFSNITGELIVKATYVQQFTVEFLDYDNRIIDIQFVEYNESATAPENPTRNNFRFIGWNTGFSNVVHDLTVKAEYIRLYKVTFLDYDGTVLKETTVDASSTAVAPSEPSKEGYTFDGWDIPFNNVASDLTITAQYTINKYSVTFKMPDGTIIKYVDQYGQTHDTQLVEHGSFAIEPEVQPYYFVWEKNGTKEYKAYGFTNWSCDFSNITSNTEVVANYSSDYNKPIITLKYYDDYGVLSPSLTLCNLSNCKMYAFNFKITYKTDDADGTYGFTIENVNTNSAANWLFNTDGAQLYNLDVNNKTKEMNFAWSNGNGITFKTYGDFINSIIITTTGGAEAEAYESFLIEECSMIVSFDDGATFSKIVPIMIYK